MDLEKEFSEINKAIKVLPGILGTINEHIEKLPEDQRQQVVDEIKKSNLSSDVKDLNKQLADLMNLAKKM